MQAGKQCRHQEIESAQYAQGREIALAAGASLHEHKDRHVAGEKAAALVNGAGDNANARAQSDDTETVTL